MLNIKNAFCLCLDKRQEHWEELRLQCESKGIKFNPYIVGDGEILPPEMYDRIDTPITDEQLRQWGYGGNNNDGNELIRKKKNGHYNAFRSHQQMAKMALETNDEYVLFLEDDAYFTERYDAVLESIEHQLKHLTWDVIYFAWWIGNEGDNFNNSIEKMWNEHKKGGLQMTKRVGGLHGAVLNRKVLDIITRLDATNPIDAQLSKYFHNKMRSFVVLPKIIHDKGIFSNCEQSTLERHKL